MTIIATDKKATWLELFYDLAFVALVAQLTYSVAEHHSTPTELFTILLAGYLIFIAWFGSTLERNIKSDETVRDTIFTQLQMIGAFMMSISVPGLFVGELWPFFLSYVLVRCLQMYTRWLYFKEHPDLAPKTHNVLQGMAVAAALFVSAGFLSLPLAFVVAGCALLIELFTPLSAGKGNQRIMLNISHLQERLGLFLILVIGESMLVVALSNSVATIDIERPLLVLCGILLMIALWWTYFRFIEQCGGNRPKSMFNFLQSHAWMYGGIVLLAAAFKNFFTDGELLLETFSMFSIGIWLISVTLLAIRAQVADRALQTGAVKLMTVGIPLLAWVGWQVGEIVPAVGLVTVWVLLLTVYDEWRRR